VDATRLRTRLKEYYHSEGAADPIVIEVPKGSYTPAFRTAPEKTSQSPAVADAPPAGEASEPAATHPSIAVLPFSNLSPEPGDYFSDGLTEEIIHALSSSREMRVVARTSSFALKHRNADVREVGRALSVAFVLEGSVRKSGNHLRITAQLVSTSDGYQLWSARYDRRIEDVFAVQDEIAGEIVKMLHSGHIREPRSSARNNAVEFEAYAWYLRGRYHLNRQTRESLHRAIECFEHALARSERFSSAISAAGTAWLYLALFSMECPLDVMSKARDAAERAIAIDPENAEAWSVGACARVILHWDWTGAEAMFRRAVQLQPGSELAKHLYVLYLHLPMARIQDSLAMIDEAARIDPLSLLVSATRGAVFLMFRRNSEAEAEYRRALELDPDFWRALVGLGRCYEAQERYQDAIACYERATAVSDRVPTAIGALGRAYALSSRRKDAYAVLKELDTLSRSRYVSPYGRVLIYLGLGDDKVFDWLDRSYDERAGWLMYLGTDPRFDSLRADSRFRSLLSRLRLPVEVPLTLAM
jgi:TolB-like protein/Tfp pilus assembly protein PilF